MIEDIPPPRSADPTTRPLSRQTKIVSWTVVLILLAGVLIWISGIAGNAGSDGDAKREQWRNRVQTVGVARATTRGVPVTIEALGTVTPIATVTVRPQVSGIITAILFQEGQIVRKGQILARIDPRPYRAQLAQATGSLARDRAQLENARLTLQRYRTLLAQDSIARQDVDTQAALVRQLEGTAAANSGAVDAARLNVGFSAIRSPVTGRIGLRATDVGNYVAAGDTNGIAVVTTVTPIDVTFAIPQDQVPVVAGKVAANSTLPAVALDRMRSDVLARGRFLTLDNQIATDTGTIRAKARFANEKGALFPNQFVNLRLQIDYIENAVVVPVTALRQAEGNDFVWLLRPDDTVVQRKVLPGQTVGTMAVVSRGLKVGDRVVSEGGDRIKQGDKVRTPEAAAKKSGGQPGDSKAT